MRIHDSRRGRAVDLPPGPLHIHVHGPGLRAFITADVLCRTAARRRSRVLLTRSGPPPRPWPLTGFNVPDVPAGDAASAQVVVAEQDPPEAACPKAAHLMLVHPIEPSSLSSLADEDPVTLRMAMLSAPYREPLRLPEQAADARARLGRWRALLAEWARSPGRPMSRRHAADAEAALAQDLDSPAALAVLEELAADPAAAPGAKLETFIHLDLLLALDLVRDIGR